MRGGRVATLVGVVLAAGCVFPDPAGPCDLDRLSCRSGGGFALDPTCTLEGELEVAVGQGYDAFESLSGGLDVQYGVQGGQHIFAAVRVANPALDRYDRLEAAFQVADPCGRGEDEGDCPWVFGERTVVLGGGASLSVTADGAVVGYGYVLVLEESPDAGHEYSVTVRDPCGRTGTATHRIR